MKEKPVPKNISKPEELDDTWETRLEKRHRDSIEADNAFKKIQTNLRNVFGPLTKLWNSVDEATENQDERLKKEEVLTSLEQTITLVAKVNNDITYTRRSRILNKFTRDKKKTSKTLKKYEELFEDTDGMLFGKSFDKKLKKKGKAKKSQHEVLMALNDGNNNRRGHRPPFQDGPASGGYRHRGAGARNRDRSREDRDRDHDNSGKNKTGNSTHTTEHVLQSNSRRGNMGDTTGSLLNKPRHKKPVQKLSAAKRTTSWKTPIFYPKLAKPHKRSKHLKSHFL